MYTASEDTHSAVATHDAADWSIAALCIFIGTLLHSDILLRYFMIVYAII